MGRAKRGGYLFLWWKGDHSPRHVHVYRGGRLVVKWDLERGIAMVGKANRRLVRLLTQLEEEGLW